MEVQKTAQIIDIDPKKILDLIGYDADSEPSYKVRKLIGDYIENYHDLVETAHTYTFRDIDSIDGSNVVLNDSTVLHSTVIANLCRKCDRIAVFVVTIGDHLEDMVSSLFDNGMFLQATVLDAIGSCAAEQMAGLIEDRIKDISWIQGQCISRRFSPGYCDWNVDQQKHLFHILNDDTAGVKITDEYLMLPRKSVSGIVGIGDPDNEADKYNPCLICGKQECPGRRN